MPYVANLRSTSTHPLDVTARSSPLVTIIVRAHTLSGYVHTASSVTTTARTSPQALVDSVMHSEQHASSSTASVTTTAKSVWPSILSVTSYSGVW